jgi:hypothetical protein
MSLDNSQREHLLGPLVGVNAYEIYDLLATISSMFEYCVRYTYVYIARKG